MATRKKSPRATESESVADAGEPQPPGERELIIITNPEAGLRAKSTGLTSLAGADVASITDLIEKEGIRLLPLFGLSEERIKSKVMEVTAAADSSVDVPDLSVYYRVDAPDERLDELAEQLLDNETVEAAYVKPPGELPQFLNDMAPAPEDAPPTTPDFNLRQGYLDAAPIGIDARYAWTLSGGRGAGVNIIDLEWAWRYSHEDLLQNQGGVVGGTQSTDLRSRNHGTAVIGEIGGDRNAIGITGICPDARVSSVAFSMASSAAIRLAADRLNAGDIILLEIHRAGPRFNFQGRNDQRGYIAIEWWPDDFDAIRYAIGRGVIVVEAAGNGAENLDDAIYSTRPTGFPSTWTNPFNRANRDSGAIVVGAGNPPPGTHGRNSQPGTGEQYVDRARCGFSNFGAVIDTQGWGWEVTATGYGDLQGGDNEDVWYTDQFSGTSSASPIIVGALGCVQGILRARSRPLLTPAQARQCLRTTGSPQTDAPGRPATQRIGNRPNLRQLITCADPTWVVKNPLKEVKNIKREIKDFKDIKLEVEKPQEKFFDKITDTINPFERFEDRFRGGGFGPQAEGGSLEERIARLESMVLGKAQAPEFEAPAPDSSCIDFREQPPGNNPNPLSIQWATFLVMDHTGASRPNTRIVNWGTLKGLDCGFALEIKLNHPCPTIEITLAHFSRPATVRAYNSNNTLAGTATMTATQAQPQTLTLSGTGIIRLRVDSPQNEVLLLKLCCVSRPKKAEGKENIKIEKIEKLEKPELKERKIEKLEKIEKIEKRESKEIIKIEKLEKPELKEFKEKERPKELKEFKEGKEIKEKEIRETGLQPSASSESTGDASSVEERLAALEQVVTEMAHFINPEMRPDLDAGALTYEEDQGGGLSALSQQLAKDAADAKQAKDNKDAEKLREY